MSDFTETETALIRALINACVREIRAQLQTHGAVTTTIFPDAAPQWISYRVFPQEASKKAGKVGKSQSIPKNPKRKAAGKKKKR